MKTANGKFLFFVCAALFWTGVVSLAENVFLDDFFNDSDNGRFVIEAEHYSVRSQGTEAQWCEVSGSDHAFLEGPMQGQQAPTRRDRCRGNYMEAIGRQIGSIAPTDETYHGPSLAYKVLIGTPGKYRLYVRWKGRDGNTDSLYAYLVDPEGALLTDAGPKWFIYHQYRSDWIWDYRGVQDTTQCAFAGFPHKAVWNISKPGPYTIVIALREAETAIDSLILQTDNLDDPGGEGPAESIMITEPSQLAAARTKQIIKAMQKEIEHLDALISSEDMVIKVIDEMIGNGAKKITISTSSAVAAKAMIESSIQQQQSSKAEFAKSIAKLEKALRLLRGDNYSEQ